MSPAILRLGADWSALDDCLRSLGAKKLLLVCGGSIARLRAGAYFEALPARLGIGVVRFSDFSPNRFLA